jgi:hypothetical protein
MRRIISLLTAAILTTSIAALTPPSSAAEPAIKTYASCRQVLKDFPHGVAMDAKSSFALYSTGWYRPKIMKRTYWANKRLDRNHNGVICEQRP